MTTVFERQPELHKNSGCAKMDQLFRQLDDAVTEFRQMARLRTRGEQDKQTFDSTLSQLHTIIDDIHYTANKEYLDSREN